MSGFDSENEMRLLRTIAVSAHKAYVYALGQGQPWEEIPEEAQDGWIRAVLVAHARSEEADGVPWREIAEEAYKIYAKAVGISVPWGHLGVNVQIAWEAASRHIVSMFEADDLTEESLQDMESRWLPWAERKLRETQREQSVATPVCRPG